MLEALKSLAARALVRLAIAAAPADLAARLRDAVQPSGGGGPRPVEPK